MTTLSILVASVTLFVLLLGIRSSDFRLSVLLGNPMGSELFKLENSREARFPSEDNPVAGLKSSAENNSLESDISKWKVYKTREGISYKTDDWSRFYQSGQVLAYSIRYPDTWTISSGVFRDGSANKIAEFSPGAVRLKPGQVCFDFLGELGENPATISQERITLGEMNGVKRIERTLYEGGTPEWVGTWYVHLYCVSNGSNAFVMSFYDAALNPMKADIYNRIISTFMFME